MINHFKKLIYLYVLIGFSIANSGSYEDFFTAIKQDNAGAVLALLKRGFDPNTPDPTGLNGLFIAVREPSPKVAEVLLDWPKADVDVRSANDETPLMMAALKGPLQLAQKLVEKGADVNKTGWAPLHYAATSGKLDIISLLLENHAYIDAESPNGSTPLMMAAGYGTASAVKLLLEEGADPLLKNKQGLTAIDFAQSAKRQESAEIIAAFVRAQQPKGRW